MLETREVQAQGLAAGSGADLDNFKSHRVHSLCDLWLERSR
jgi:hypothetical protein